MARKTTYLFEDENGNEHSYEIIYDIISAHSNAFSEEADLDSVALVKVTEDGNELTNLDVQLIENIKYHCLQEFDDDQWDYEQD